MANPKNGKQSFRHSVPKRKLGSEWNLQNLNCLVI
jgi:hypothetical protein